MLKLKEQVTILKSRSDPRLRTSTPPPAPLEHPPASASPPSFPSTSRASMTASLRSSASLPPSQPAAPSYAQTARGPQVREEEQDGPITFKPAPRPQGKVAHLLLADSVTRAVVYPKLEAPTGSTIKQVNTYSSQYDEKAHKPNRNVAEVIRQELAKKKYHTVILGAPTADITNQDVSDGIMDENEAETIASSYAMVEAAEYAVKSGGATKVIVLHHVPRYDNPRTDPHGARPQLARLANLHLLRARDASLYAEHILVGEHSGMECDGVTRTDRFTNDQTHIKNWAVRPGKYDGVHLYSQEGAEALTSSLLAILHRAGMVRRPQQWGLSSSSPSSSSSGQWTSQQSARGFRRNQSHQSGVPDRSSSCCQSETYSRIFSRRGRCPSE